jgi:hypothetical protein
LANTPWLARCRIHYWGDISIHGFAILRKRLRLDQERIGFNSVASPWAPLKKSAG